MTIVLGAISDAGAPLSEIIEHVAHTRATLGSLVIGEALDA